MAVCQHTSRSHNEIAHASFGVALQRDRTVTSQSSQRRLYNNRQQKPPVRGLDVAWFFTLTHLTSDQALNVHHWFSSWHVPIFLTYSACICRRFWWTAVFIWLRFQKFTCWAYYWNTACFCPVKTALFLADLENRLLKKTTPWAVKTSHFLCFR